MGNVEYQHNHWHTVSVCSCFLLIIQPHKYRHISVSLGSWNFLRIQDSDQRDGVGGRTSWNKENNTTNVTFQRKRILKLLSVIVMTMVWRWLSCSKIPLNTRNAEDVGCMIMRRLVFLDISITTTTFTQKQHVHIKQFLQYMGLLACYIHLLVVHHIFLQAEKT